MNGMPPFGDSTVICHATMGHVQVDVRTHENVKYVVFNKQPGTCSILRMIRGASGFRTIQPDTFRGDIVHDP